MKQNEITRDDINFYERTLKNYFYLLKREQFIQREIWRYEELIENERKVRGISFDEKTGTYNNTDTPYICELIHDKAGYEIEAERLKRDYLSLDKNNKISKRLGTLSKRQLEMIILAFRTGLSFDAIANKQSKAIHKKVSKQAINDQIDNLIRKMLEVI